MPMGASEPRQWAQLEWLEFVVHAAVVVGTILVLAPPFSSQLRSQCLQSRRCRYYLGPSVFPGFQDDRADTQWRMLRQSGFELVGKQRRIQWPTSLRLLWWCHGLWVSLTCMSGLRVGVLFWLAPGGCVLYTAASFLLRQACRRCSNATRTRAHVLFGLLISAGTIAYLHGSGALIIAGLVLLNYTIGALFGSLKLSVAGEKAGGKVVGSSLQMLCCPQHEVAHNWCTNGVGSGAQVFSRASLWFQR